MMAADPSTILLLSLLIAVVASAYLAHEARRARDPALALWSAGFGVIALGCLLAPLRQAGFLYIGVWLANGLLIVAHLLLLGGMARYARRPIALAWSAVLLPWLPMLAVVPDAAHSGLYGVVTATLVAVLALRTARLPFEAGAEAAQARRLGRLFQCHGLFYLAKAALVFLPGAFTDMTRLKGVLIQVSLLEGVMVEVLLALLMAAAVGLRREDRVTALAKSDPLTGLLNRRGFQAQAKDRLGASEDGWTAGVLLLIDVDHFKTVNDTAGHATGDRLLVALAETLMAHRPDDALVARLGGDEFVMLAPDIDAAGLKALTGALRRDFTAAGADLLPPGVAVSLSLGAALLDGTPDLDILTDRADAALYTAKRQGRDRLAMAPGVRDTRAREAASVATAA